MFKCHVNNSGSGVLAVNAQPIYHSCVIAHAISHNGYFHGEALYSGLLFTP